MIKKLGVLLTFTILPLLVKSQDHFITDLGLRALIHGEENSFWSHSNNNGLVDKGTWLLGTVNTEYSTYLSEHSRLAFGGGIYYALNQDQEDGAAINQYYGVYELYNFGLTLGAKQRPLKRMGLSSVGGDILWSNNARPVPGIEVATIIPLKISNVISLDGAFGHYFLNDDRYVDKPRLHYKHLTFNFNTSKNSVFSLGIHHYAQWGGNSPNLGPQPDGLKDYLRIVFGLSGTTYSSMGDQINALGNHIGSYHLDYKYNFRDSQQLHLYYQTIFEDTSGREWQNFPDGVWGAFWSAPKNKYVQGLLYEYQHTLSQSGYAVNRGSDNYFSNGTYRSGWTHFGKVIGTPFITPNEEVTAIINNTYAAHHIGITGELSKIGYMVKGSYVENRGRHRNPWDPTHKNIYTYLSLNYQPSEREYYGISLGTDFNDPNDNQFTLGLEYRYRFGRLDRSMEECNCRRNL